MLPGLRTELKCDLGIVATEIDDDTEATGELSAARTNAAIVFAEG